MDILYTHIDILYTTIHMYILYMHIDVQYSAMHMVQIPKKLLLANINVLTQISKSFENHTMLEIILICDS